MASLGYLHEEFGEAMALIADGRVRVGPLHDATVGLYDLPGAIERLADDPSSARQGPGRPPLVSRTGGSAHRRRRCPSAMLVWWKRCARRLVDPSPRTRWARGPGRAPRPGRAVAGCATSSTVAGPAVGHRRHHDHDVWRPGPTARSWMPTSHQDVLARYDVHAGSLAGVVTGPDLPPYRARFERFQPSSSPTTCGCGRRLRRLRSRRRLVAFVSAADDDNDQWILGLSDDGRTIGTSTPRSSTSPPTWPRSVTTSSRPAGGATARRSSRSTAASTQTPTSRLGAAVLDRPAARPRRDRGRAGAAVPPTSSTSSTATTATASSASTRPPARKRTSPRPTAPGRWAAPRPPTPWPTSSPSSTSTRSSGR